MLIIRQKIFLIFHPPLKNSTTRIAIVAKAQELKEEKEKWVIF